MALKVQIWLLCFSFVLTQMSSGEILVENQSDDIVEIEADDAVEPSKRDARQVLIRGALPHPLMRFQNQFLLGQNALGQQPLLATAGPCLTGKGLLGKCSSFRECYPYFKIPELNNFESWILGMYDTCSYYTAQGRQMFGVCCTTLEKPPEIASSTPTVVVAPSPIPEPVVSPQNGSKSELTSIYYPQYPNWPPQVPTHPPNHTIPPLPTHPPSPGYPNFTPPTTVAPPPVPSWPQTVHPTYTTITSTTRTTRRPLVTPATQPPPPPPPSSPSVTCGSKNGHQDQERIVGGHNAEVGEWPWVAALFNSGRQFCGGSLVDSTHILTAAHCVAHMSSWDVARLTVRLGDHNIKSNTETSHIEKRVKRVVRHRGFDPRTLYNDVAILTLDSPVQFTNQIRAICLPTPGNDFAGHTGTVIGWGSLRESGPQPAVLQEVSIPIWSNQDCKLKYGPAAPGGIVDHMLCAGQAARDSCSGDSGGPLMVNTGRWTQVGIVSWGIGCGKGQYPGVYTRVEKFLPWITKNLK